MASFTGDLPGISDWGMSSQTLYHINTAISRKVVRKNVQVTIPKGNMGYDEYTVRDTIVVEPTFDAFI